ncbi:MAG: PAS domain-containing protein [Sneathiella sp.]|uniref:PAS domain-containing protein n=1 Tax=Sneathiella sp. TaxID=1964365 RepID=UPI003002EF67
MDKALVGAINLDVRLRSPVNISSLDYWGGLRGARSMPSRADMSPADMVSFLPNVILLDVMAGPQDFKYRLVGTKVTLQMLHTDNTGKTMRELGFKGQGPDSKIFSNCVKVVETRQPLAGQTPYTGKNSDFKATEDIIMPLSQDGETVNMLFVTCEFID